MSSSGAPPPGPGDAAAAGAAPSGGGKPAKERDPTHPVQAIKDAIRALNQLDDLMLVNYQDTNTPAVTTAINNFVGALKRVQDGRHRVDGEIPLELLDRIDREDLSPNVFTIESLERAVSEVKSLGQRDQMFDDLRRGIEQGMAAADEEPAASAGAGGAGAQAMDTSN